MQIVQLAAQVRPHESPGRVAFGESLLLAESAPNRQVSGRARRPQAADRRRAPSSGRLAQHGPGPRGPQFVYMDATALFPLPDASFDYIFSEHVIEHMSYADGGRMLRECLGVLKPGGRIRIATPNLVRLLGLYAARPERDAGAVPAVDHGAVPPGRAFGSSVLRHQQRLPQLGPSVPLR